MKSPISTLFWFTVAVLAMGLIVSKLLGPGSGPPAAFADGTTFEDALARSELTGKPVLVLATADWCRPCQHLKKTTLNDERVAAAIKERTVPVYLDLTNQVASTPEMRIAHQINIQSMPTLVLLRNDREVSRRVGTMPPVDFLSWLEGN